MTSAPPRHTRTVQPRAESAATRSRILDCAEELFALRGFHGVSVRDIASSANVQFALVGYHFGSKAELFDSVILRRSTVLNQEREQFLTDALQASGGAPLPVRTLLEGYMGSLISKAAQSDPGWRSYSQLVSSLAGSAEWAELIAKKFDAIGKLYLREFQRTLPAATHESLLHAYFFALGVTVAVCARPRRIESLSEGKFESENLERLYENMRTFLEGGFERVALANSTSNPR
jgi:AcrR family transcriptional regulator